MWHGSPRGMFAEYSYSAMPGLLFMSAVEDVEKEVDQRPIQDL